MQQQYPQGMRKKPITLSNPDGSGRKFNSYLEALDYQRGLRKTYMDDSPFIDEKRAIDAKYQKEYDQAVREGYKPRTRNDGMQDPVRDKELWFKKAIDERNAAFMQNVANRNYRTQSPMSAAMQVKNTKPGQK